MRWLAHNWPYILIGYALLSASATGGWFAMCHIVWLRERRNAQQGIVVQLATKKGRRPAA